MAEFLVEEALSVTELADGTRLTRLDRTIKTPEEQAAGDRQKRIDDFLSLARKRFRTVAAAEVKLREDQLDDLYFRASEQWSERSLTERAQDERPAITINRLPQFIRQVLNAMRAANLAIRVLPVDNGADRETAKVFAGLIKHIETQSDAQVAYGTAAEAQTTIGRGWFRIAAEWDDPKSWVQSLFIRRIRNAFTVYMDPASVELDGSDARYVFLVEDMPNDEFDHKYGADQRSSLADFSTRGNEEVQDWMPEGRTRIAEYWYVVEEPDTLHLIEWPDGQQESMLESEILGAPAELQAEIRGFSIKQRKTTNRRVESALISATAVLEGNADKTGGALWPGKWIPFVPVIGDELDINGRVDYRGMVRDAKGAQRLYNFQNTALAEALALAPLAQWVGYEGQFEGHEEKWRTANRRRHPYLQVKPFSIDGTPAPLPQRITTSPAIEAIVVAIHQHNNDLQATMGLYDPSLGQRGPQQSGKAISALQRQGEMANSNFLDNLSRSLRHAGRLLVNLIPKYMDVPTVRRILGPDDQEMTVMTHAGADPSKLTAPDPMPPAWFGIYDLGAGRYDVAVSVGPSLPTRRAEALQMLTEFVQAYPDAFPMMADIIVKNMDFPGAEALYDRLKKMVPPQFQDAKPGDVQLPPEAQAQMAAMQQQLEMAMAAAQEFKQQIDTKRVESEHKLAVEQLSVASKERIEQMRVATEQMKIEAKAAADANLAKLNADLKARLTVLEATLEAKQAEIDAANEREMERERQVHDAALAERQHEHGVEDDVRGRIFDREDSTLERQANREDADRARQGDREDRDRERTEDRKDKRMDRIADRTDRDADRRDDRIDRAVDRDGERTDRHTERQEDRRDRATERKEDRKDAATERQTQKKGENPKK